MPGGIFLLKEGGDLVEMSETRYATEDLLQSLLARYPSVLAGDQIDPEAPRRWLLVAREMAVPGEEDGNGRWSIDHLFLDQEAVPTLVEVKRSTDTRIRREVVGQMLDYAANAARYWTLDSVMAAFERTCEKTGQTTDERLAAFLGEDGNAEAYWQALKTNLQAGRMRLVFVADELPQELRRIIEFLNEQMDPAEVLGLELRQYVGGAQTTLVPRVVGQTALSQGRKAPGQRVKGKWDEAKFFADILQKRGPDDAAIARHLYDWARAHGLDISWGKGAVEGSFTPRLVQNGIACPLFVVFSRSGLYLYLDLLSKKPPLDQPGAMESVVARLNQETLLAIPVEKTRGYAPAKLTLLKDPSALAGFTATFDDVIDTLRTVPAK